jgi:predicted HicB family RNase H-like nuclease
MRMDSGMTQEIREVEKAYSGKVNLRMPKSLHRDLARRAEEEGVSLNQFMVVALARAVGKESPNSSEKEPDAEA